MREGLAFISNINERQHWYFSPPFLRICLSCIYGRPGCSPGAWSSWVFASCQFAPKIVGLSVRFIRILFYIFFLVSKRSGGNLIIGVLLQNREGNSSTHWKKTGGRIGTVTVTPAGPVLSLEVSVVATISLSFDSFSIPIRASKIRFSIFCAFCFFVWFLEVSVIATISLTV